MPHVCRVQFDTLGNCFPFGIVLRDGERVARLLVRLPHINSDGLPPGKKAGRHQEHSATTTPQIKDLLISTQSKPEQDFCPDLEFAPARGIDIARCAQKHKGAIDQANHPNNLCTEPQNIDETKR